MINIKDAGVMMTPDGRLYLSTAAIEGKDQTRSWNKNFMFLNSTKI